jgi:peptidoglycan/xylan/chitin deacetylase (PgdA/CDA1 family)
MSLLKLANSLAAPALASARVFEAACRDAVFVFNYHEVSDAPAAFSRDFNLNVTPAVFARQLRWIRTHFNVLTPEQLLSNRFDRPAAFITFDDGFRSAFRQAASMLRDEKLPATVFMNMAPVQGHAFWSGIVTYLSRHSAPFARFVAAKYGAAMTPDFFLRCRPADVEEFRAEGHDGDFEAAARYCGPFATDEDLARSADDGLWLGNHLFNHYNAATLSLDELARQYTENDRAIAVFRNRVSLFSYPFGQPGCYTAETDALLISLGAKRLFTAFPLPNRTTGALRLHRTSMFEHVDTERRFRANCLVPALINGALRRRHAYV